MADYEYFYMGERGDQYRNVGWPNVIPTAYIVDPTYAYGYDTIGIHFAYTGSNHAIQKSEKDITFIIPAVASPNASGLGHTADALVAAIEAAIDPGFLKKGPVAASGYIPVYTSDGSLEASAKKPGDIS